MRSPLRELCLTTQSDIRSHLIRLAEGFALRPTASPSVYDRRMDAPSSDLTAFILAGGKSTRMGSDKAFVVLDGRTLLARALELARSVTSEVRIVGDPAKFAEFAARAPVVED